MSFWEWMKMLEAPQLKTTWDHNWYSNLPLKMSQNGALQTNTSDSNGGTHFLVPKPSCQISACPNSLSTIYQTSPSLHCIIKHIRHVVLNFHRLLSCRSETIHPWNFTWIKNWWYVKGVFETIISKKNIYIYIYVGYVKIPEVDAKISANDHHCFHCHIHVHWLYSSDSGDGCCGSGPRIETFKVTFKIPTT